MKRIGITLGDPTGIGPEITRKALQKYQPDATIILYGNLPPQLSLPRSKTISTVDEAVEKDTTYLLPLENETKFIPGEPSIASGKAAYNAIANAGKDAMQNKLAAIVTAPLSKKYIQKSRSEFIGHTEFFAKLSRTSNFVMCFYSKKIIVALLTTHVAIKNLDKKLNYDGIYNKIKLIHKFTRKIKQKRKPKLALLGINPHSGEDGIFGSLEIKLFRPLLNNLKNDGINISGPFPADTFFASNYQKFDAIISAYHDQGLIPFKMLTFGQGVNTTLGLPFIRTSVDHGTAFDIAGKEKANCGSLVEAIKLAVKLI